MRFFYLQKLKILVLNLYLCTNSCICQQSCEELRTAIQKLDPSIVHKALPFVETMASFNKVVDSCCSQKLLPSYKTDVPNFTDLYHQLGIRVTLEVTDKLNT